MKIMRARGSTTLEILASLAIMAPALLALGTSLHNSVKSFFKAKLEAQAGLSHLRLRNTLSGLMDELDSHRLIIMPRIHKAGLISFTDGTPNPAMRATGGRRPSVESDALTGMQLDYLRMQRVLKSEQAGAQTIFYACNRLEPGFRADDYKGFIGLSVDEIFELTGEVRPHPGRQDCHDFYLAAQRSMSVPPAPSGNIENVRLLIPMLSHYTWYVDEKNRLRYLSHSGEHNIENQPAINDFGKLKLTLTESPGPIFFLAGTHKLITGKTLEFSFNNHLSRLPALNLLLNQP